MREIKTFKELKFKKILLHTLPRVWIVYFYKMCKIIYFVFHIERGEVLPVQQPLVE